MDEKKFFLVLNEPELAALDIALEGLVDIAFREQNKQLMTTLLGIQLKCRDKREVKSPAKSWTAVAKDVVSGKGVGGK